VPKTSPGDQVNCANRLANLYATKSKRDIWWEFTR
jgi:hypothetical protein